MTDRWSRRDCMLALAGGAALAPSLSQPANGMPSQLDTAVQLFSDPPQNLEAVVRVMGDTRDRLAPWWYTGHIYGVRPGEAPAPLVRFEGAEINFFVRQSDGSFRQTGTTTTFYQDIASGVVLQEFRNPYTGKTNAVRPNKLGGSGYVSWSTAGIEPVWRAFGKLQPKPLEVQWTAFGDLVWMRHDRVFPAAMPQPIHEASTSIVKRRELLNRRLGSCPAQFSSSYIARWPAWMEMGDTPGHVVWHADGLKLPNIEALPRAYLQRVRAEMPQQLDVPAPPS